MAELNVFADTTVINARNLVAVLVLLLLSGCGAQMRPGLAAPPTVAPTATDHTSSVMAVCAPAWEQWPSVSATILGGAVELPPWTRVIGVDSAPGEAVGTLCTAEATPARIDQFLRAHLPSNGWLYSTATSEWKRGPVESFSYEVTDSRHWTVHCLCGGI